ncbi:hypothetical protein M569_06109, partial [Genlisea aurea]
MNIVKGVADLIWRSSSGQTGELYSVSASGRFPLPKALLGIFLKQFLITFLEWKPLNLIQTPGEEYAVSSVGHMQNVDDVVVGCSFGHPADVILAFIDEMCLLTKLLTNSQLDCTSNLSISSESLMTLDALTIVTLSAHNCQIIGHHSAVQKITTLMKAAAVLLKTITNSIPLERSQSNYLVQNAITLQKILVFVVLIICNFVDVLSSIEKDAESSEVKTSGINSRASAIQPPNSVATLSWHQVAIVSVMEAGGLNWLVEILRLLRRLILKEQWIEMPLQHVTLRTLQSVLTDNFRGQNHFRSIGGLEVLLDGLGVRPFYSLVVNEPFGATESYGNFSNLQFLCENGRVQKFANTFCSLVFIIQDCMVFKSSSGGDNLTPSPFSQSFVQHWKNYVTRMSSALCHFILEAEEIEIHSIQSNSSAKNPILVSPAYAELLLKWFTKVVLAVFPCIRACSNQNGILRHMRFFAFTLQQYVLFAFKKVLQSLPSLIDVFRAEGLWDFIISENFLYFGPSSSEYSLENIGIDVSSMDAEMYGVDSYSEQQADTSPVEKFQLEAISFLEYAATLSGSTHNLPECTVLLDALEQSACNPVLATALSKSLVHILQLSTEKTVSSFKALDAVHCFLKVACVQVQESNSVCSMNNATQTMENSSCQTIRSSYSSDLSKSREKCLKICLELFENYFSFSEDAKYSILRNTFCITCVFDLLWDESLRNVMLKYVIELMKVVPSSEDDKKGKLLLCSKYFETFTYLKEHLKDFVGPSIELLVGMRTMLLTDRVYYQSLFRECECFLHVISLLNGHMDVDSGGKLSLNVIQTLTCLLSANDSSKAAFRSLVGGGYQTFRSLLLDFYQWKPNEALLNSLLDMLVDGNFDLTWNCIIKNDDVILLYLSVLQKSNDALLQYGLQLFHNMLRDSLSNRESCVRAGMLEFLLDWIATDDSNAVLLKISPLIEVVGGHSISGKDIRKMFAMLRGEGICLPEHSRSAILSSMLMMMNEKGPSAFFDLSGIDSGIVIKNALHMPVNKGFSFTCWLRVENFSRDGAMALFSFLTEYGKGCYAVIANGNLIYEIGPTYLFSDVISSEAVQCIYSLGPSYMYYFRDNDFFLNGVLDTKEAFAPKVIFGFNAQASNGRTLFNVSPNAVCVLEKDHSEAAVLPGTQLCSRRLLQQIIYCVGGISVFFPLFVLSDLSEINRGDQYKEKTLSPTMHGTFTNEAIKLIASVLDDNFANQQQMLLNSGFSILGFLLQSMPSNLISLDTLAALKHLFSVTVKSGLAEILLKDAVSYVFLNPRIWLHVVYTVQRELYMFLIQQFDNDPKLLKGLCRLDHLLDIIRQFYSDSIESSTARRKLSFLSLGKRSVLERPDVEEIRKIRLLLFSLAEMSLSEQITAPDIKALVAFCETCQDMACLEDILNMIFRLTCQKRLLSLFLEQVNIVGGVIIFVNLLERNFEPVRLLALQIISRLVVGSPADKKGSKFFSISIGRSKYLPEVFGSAGLDSQPIFSLMSDKIFAFPQTDELCAALFDALLGGASPKQVVLRKNNQFDRDKGGKSNVGLVLPQILPLIFRFLSCCEDISSRIKIMADIFDLIYSNPSNVNAFLDNGWNSWLAASVKLDILKNYNDKRQFSDGSEMNEKHFVINIYSFVLLHRILYVKGGWQDLEETVNFLLCQGELVGTSYQYQCFLRDLYEDVICKLTSLSDEDKFFVSLPSRDNMLYLLKLVDEMLLFDMGYCLPFPSRSPNFPQFMELVDCPELNVALFEAFQSEATEDMLGSGMDKHHSYIQSGKIPDDFWNIYDKLWVLIGKMNGKESSMVLSRSSSSAVPSLTQRARGLVESLNIPAAEMAAAVSGGISSALVGKSSKNIDRAMQLRGEGCSRFVNRLLIFYLCRSSLERASECVQQVVPVLPFLLAVDDEQSKSRLQFFIWALLVVRSQYGVLDGGARFHVISNLIRETINCGKAMLVTSNTGSDNLPEFLSNSKQWSTVFNFIQKDKLFTAAVDEMKYIKSIKDDRILQLCELGSKMEESITIDSNLKKALVERIQISVCSILTSDDSRRYSFQLFVDEDQQIIAEKCIHTLRLLADERGPWSANPFPNSIASHWKLDKTEDAWRRRLKLRRNYHFDVTLCLPSSLVPGNAVLSATDSKNGLGPLPFEMIRQFSLKGIQKIVEDNPQESIDSEDQQKDSEIEKSEHSEVKAERTGQDFTQDKENLHLEKDSENTEVLMIIPCVLVTPKRKLAGCMEIMKEYLRFCGEYLVEGTGSSFSLRTYYSSGDSDFSKLEGLVRPQRQVLLKWRMHQRLDSRRLDMNEATISDNSDKEQKLKRCIKRHRCWNMSKIKAVHWTRYLLRYTAIEIFFSDSGAPAFFNFSSQKVAKTVGSLIVATRNEYINLKRLKYRTGSISFVDRRLAQEMAETARESWRRREITNFEYLMILNTLSGRSYSDITQYPVFPWVLADYLSESLDLNKSSTFRDLSKPVGALDPKRFEVFEDRYNNFVDPDIPSFYYGSHYSSMGIVLFYLLRLEPFTALHRSLQGGKFDHADRLFQSIEGTFKNCLSNTSDVKELIPEFFYMPEFLRNSNSYHFGIKQDGEPLGDVCLPPWAQ